MQQERNWSFVDAWNNSVISTNRTLEPRDYVYASELGYPLIDTWLKMKGVQPTNPPNERSLRKFEAGNIWEWIARFVLTRAGIIRDCQERVHYQYEGLVRVSGRLDFLAGGMPDFDKAKEDLSSLYLPYSILNASINIVDKLKAQNGNKPLKELVLELKSCSTFVMDTLERTEKPLHHHEFQIYHYLRGLNMPEGRLVYICKDDCRMMEFKVLLTDTEIEDEMKTILKQVTYYYENDIQPPIEPLVKFVPEEGRFKKNIFIEYSGYLTMLYGFETPRDYSDSVKSKIARYNRVLARYVKGDKITKKNEEVREEIEKDGYVFEELLAAAALVGVESEDED